ncbi:hypothetical protein A5844_002668, partial [Enterococcus sp. 10A9_DIV0425]
MLKKRLLPIMCLLCILTFAGCGVSTNTEEANTKDTTTSLLTDPYSDEQFLLGTYVRIRVYDKDKEEALKPAFDRVKELGDKITINQSGSEIDEINQQAGIKPVKVSDDVYTLLKKAYEYS